MANTEPNEAALTSYDLGNGVTRTDTGKDPSNIVGKTANVPNRLWGARLTGVTKCNVSGFIGTHKFGRSGQRPAYVIQATDDNLFYPIAAYYIEHLVHTMPRDAAQQATQYDVDGAGNALACIHHPFNECSYIVSRRDHGDLVPIKTGHKVFVKVPCCAYLIKVSARMSHIGNTCINGTWRSRKPFVIRISIRYPTPPSHNHITPVDTGDTTFSIESWGIRGKGWVYFKGEHSCTA